MATEDLFSIVEQLVCVAATRFVGTPGSTWSAYVHRERANRGANRGQSLSTTQFISKFNVKGGMRRTVYERLVTKV